MKSCFGSHYSFSEQKTYSKIFMLYSFLNHFLHQNKSIPLGTRFFSISKKKTSLIANQIISIFFLYLNCFKNKVLSRNEVFYTLIPYSHKKNVLKMLEIRRYDFLFISPYRFWHIDFIEKKLLNRKNIHDAQSFFSIKKNSDFCFGSCSHRKSLFFKNLTGMCCKASLGVVHPSTSFI